MGVEIERRFLVKGDDWKNERFLGGPHLIRQGYLCTDFRRTVRIRTSRHMVSNDSTAYITIKGEKKNYAGAEYEYKIPPDDAVEMLQLCMSRLTKVRYQVTGFNGHIWEVDEFKDHNDGLVIAEIEMERSNTEIVLPEWIGREISEDFDYTNVSLCQRRVSRV